MIPRLHNWLAYRVVRFGVWLIPNGWVSPQVRSSLSVWGGEDMRNYLPVRKPPLELCYPTSLPIPALGIPHPERGAMLGKMPSVEESERTLSAYLRPDGGKAPD